MKKEKGIEHVLVAGHISQKVLGVVRSDGWKHIIHYLRAKRREESRKMIYVYRLPQNEHEFTASQARIRLIDDILADTDEKTLKLASDVADQCGNPADAPYNVE